MSDVAMSCETESGDGAFNARLMLVVTAVGVLAFIAMLVLGAYAPDLRSGHNGGPHALSNGATGFSGLVRLAEATGQHPVIVRSVPDFDSEDLAVITPDHGWAQLGDILQARGARATLVVLPKWNSQADPLKTGWVRIAGLLPTDDPERTLAPADPFVIRRDRTQGQPLRTLDPNRAGRNSAFSLPRVAADTDRSAREAADRRRQRPGRAGPGRQRPSLRACRPRSHQQSRHGRRAAGAGGGCAPSISSTAPAPRPFCSTSPPTGSAGRRSPLKLAFDAPFLAVTLTLFAAMAAGRMAGARPLRAGAPPRPRDRVRQGGAGRQQCRPDPQSSGAKPRSDARYVELIQRARGRAVRLACRRSAGARRAPRNRSTRDAAFIAAAQAATQARSRDELLGAAQSLHQWLEEIQR